MIRDLYDDEQYVIKVDGEPFFFGNVKQYILPVYDILLQKYKGSKVELVIEKY